MIETLPNFIDGSWRTSDAAATLNVLNPASAQAPGASASLAGRGGGIRPRQTAARAFAAWRRTPAERARPAAIQVEGLARTEHRRPGAHHHE